MTHNETNGRGLGRVAAIAVAGLAVVVGTTRVGAQVDLERFDRTLEQIQRQTRLQAESAVPAGQRALFDYGGYLTFNFLSIDDIDQSTHVLRQTDLNDYARLNVNQVHEALIRVRSSYRDFNTGESFDGHGDDWVEPTLDRASYRFDLQRALAAYEDTVIDGNLVVEGGRRLVHWANGLVLSEELDGGQITGTWGDVSLLVLGGRTRKGVTDIDSSRPGFDDDTQRNFYGGMVTLQRWPRHQPFVYGLVQEDDNDNEVFATTVAGSAVSTRFGYDSFYIGGGSRGSLGDQLLYSVEAAYQGGSTLSNSFSPATGAQVTQTLDDISAWALDATLDYLFADAHRTRLSAELLLASGDDDRLTTTNTFGGNQPGTDDHSFNAFGLINTGLAFAPDVSNLFMVRGGISTFPMPNNRCFRRLQIGADLFVLNKLDRDAPIDESTSGHRHLGIEADLYANWQITSDVSLALRYGVFFPGKAIVAEHDARHFFYTGLTFAF